jgi:hypothetical protein
VATGRRMNGEERLKGKSPAIQLRETYYRQALGSSSEIRLGVDTRLFGREEQSRGFHRAFLAIRYAWERCFDASALCGRRYCTGCWGAMRGPQCPKSLVFVSFGKITITAPYPGSCLDSGNS